MQLPVSTPRHDCHCHSRVSEVSRAGAIVWSDSEVVRGKALAAFGEAAPGTARLEGEGWSDRLAAFVDALSPVEVATVKVAAVEQDGRSEPWAAVGVRAFLDRLRAPWLPAVLNDNALVTYFQPIVETASGRTAAFECLARARVDGRLVAGGELVDAARADGALFQFDQKARTNAIRHGTPRLLPGESLYINFTPLVIYDPKICLRTTWEAAREVGCAMEQLVFEVVESETFPDIAHLRHILDTYREQGCRVALDDLGTGHTALSFIDKLRPDVIKLAKGLMPDRPRPDDLALVRGLVEHARNRGITTLIEGVETHEQLAAARDLGIDLVQGYLLGKPAAEPVRPVAEQARLRRLTRSRGPTLGPLVVPGG